MEILLQKQEFHYSRWNKSKEKYKNFTSLFIDKRELSKKKLRIKRSEDLGERSFYYILESYF